MRREFFLHLAFLVSFFLLVSVFRNWFSFSYWPFWVGGFFGAFLPDIDHLIYIYFLRPEELTSQRANYMLNKRNFGGTVSLLTDTKEERKTLVFHTILFQVIFLILTFLVLTSSGSLFGTGLVLAFSLHFLVDQIIDIRENSWSRWLHQIPFPLEKDQFRFYWWVILILVLLFGFLL